MEQIAILAFIGLISLINWLVQRSGEQREQKALEQRDAQTEAAEPQDVAVASERRLQPDFDAEMQLRRFLEGVGLPVATPPPPLPLDPEPVMAYPTPAPRRVAPAETKPGTAKSRADSRRKTLAESLRSGAEIRRAIVLSEILGPPKSLRSD